MKTESMLSAGIDIGTTTTHLVISRIGIGVTEGFGTVPSVHIDVLTDFLGDAELKSIMSDGYNAYVFIGNELKSARFKYGSDAGAGMAATYHSMIGTVKLHGSSVWNFIGTFFKKIFNGCRDYVNMVPDKITLATSQC